MNKSIFKLLDRPIGLPSFSSSLKCDWLGIGTAIAGGLNAGSNLIGTVLTNNANMRIAEHTNNTNLLLAQRANELNDQHFKDQQRFDWDMWRRTNEYNSPAAQRERLLAAGINPRIALGDNPAEAQTLSSPSPQPAQIPGLVTPQLQAPHFDLSNIFSGFSAEADIKQKIAEAKKANNEAEGMAIDNQTRHQVNLVTLAKTIEEIGAMKLDSDQKSWLIKLAKQEFETKERNKEYIDKKYKGEADNLQALSDKTTAEANEAQTRAEYAQKLAESELRLNEHQISVLAATYAKIQAERLNIDEDTRLKHSQRADVTSGTNLKRQEFSQKQQEFNLVLEGLHNANLISYAQYKRTIAESNSINDERKWENWKRNSPVYRIVSQLSGIIGISLK